MPLFAFLLCVCPEITKRGNVAENNNTKKKKKLINAKRQETEVKTSLLFRLLFSRSCSSVKISGCLLLGLRNVAHQEHLLWTSVPFVLVLAMMTLFFGS